MKQKLVKGVRWLTESRGLPLVALAVLGMVTVMPGWVRAQSETTTTFTSPLPGGQHGEHGGPNDEIRELLDSIVDRDEILAAVLGITAEELAAAKEAGASIDELIAEAGLDKETVRTEMKDAITEAVEQAVTDGTLTQEQADLILTPPAPPQHDGQQESGHHRGPGNGPNDSHATPTPTNGTPEATTTAEATPVPEATTADSVAANGAGDNGDRPRPHHDQQPAQNSDTSSTSSSASDSSTTSSASTSSDTASGTSDNTAADNEQPASDRPDRGGGHQRPGR